MTRDESSSTRLERIRFAQGARFECGDLARLGRPCAAFSHPHPAIAVND
jgi:hypothetical protein